MALPDALIALWLAAPRRRSRPNTTARVSIVAALGLAASATATWFLRVVFDRMQRRFRDKISVALEAHVATLAGVGRDHRAPRATRVPRPARRCCATRCSRSTTSSCRCSRRSAGSSGSASRWSCSSPSARCSCSCRCSRCPIVLTTTWRPGVERRVEESVAPHDRLATPPVRARHDRARRARSCASTGIGAQLVARAARAAWDAVVRPVATCAVDHGAVAHARVGDLRRRVRRRDRLRGGRARRERRRRRARRHRRQPAVAVRRRGGRRARLPARHLARLVAPARVARGLRRRARRARRRGRCPTASTRRHRASSTCRSRIRAPTTTRSTDVEPRAARRRGDRARRRERRGQEHAREAARRHVHARPAGASRSTASTSRAWRPTSGATRLAGAFQDFYRFEFLAPGDASASATTRDIDERPAVERAVGRAGADDVVDAARGRARHPARPDVGRRRRRELRAVAEARAVARGFMRDEPLLLVLDEPTAALDAETEHALFERFAAAARGADADATAASRSSCRTASRRCAWPT